MRKWNGWWMMWTEIDRIIFGSWRTESLVSMHPNKKSTANSLILSSSRNISFFKGFHKKSIKCHLIPFYGLARSTPEIFSILFMNLFGINQFTLNRSSVCYERHRQSFRWIFFIHPTHTSFIPYFSLYFIYLF